MSRLENGQFSCSTCGRNHLWSPETSGLQIQCPCGEFLLVPRPDWDADDFGEYDLADKPRTPQTSSFPAQLPRRIAGDPHLHSGPAIAKADRQIKIESLTHPLRDFHIPIALLAVSVVSTFIWAFLIVQSQSFHALGWFYLETFLKLLILVGLSMLVAPAVDVHLGPLGSCILKLSAIVVGCQATLLWLDVILHALGGISPRGDEPWEASVMRFGISVLFIGLAAIWFFRMEILDAARLTLILTLLFTFVGWGMRIASVGGMNNYLAIVNPPPFVQIPARRVPRPFVMPTPTIADDLNVPVSHTDQQISDRLKQNDSRLVAGEDWKNKAMDQFTDTWIDRFRLAGAKNIYIDTRSASRTWRERAAVAAYVELSSDADHRASCEAVYQNFMIANAQDPVPTVEDQKFLILPLPK